MSEVQPLLFEPTFNRAVKVKASDDRITSDAGLLLLREADHRLGVTEALANKLHDPRQPSAIRYQLVELLRERIYGLAQGYATQDDADRLAHDPAMKLAAWDRPGEQTLDERLASQPTQSRLIDILTMNTNNRAALRDSLADACERHLRATGGDTAARHVTIDLDSLPIAVHGRSSRSEDRSIESHPRVFLSRGRLERIGVRWRGGAGALPPARPRSRIGSASFSKRSMCGPAHNDFAANEALLRLSLLAFNLASMLRIEYEAEAGSCFDLGRFQRDVMKAGARVAKGSRRLIVHVACVIAPFWQRLLAAIERWRLPPRFPSPRGPRRLDWRPPPRHAFAQEVRRL